MGTLYLCAELEKVVEAKKGQKAPVSGMGDQQY